VRAYEYNLGGNGKSQILGTSGFVSAGESTDGPVVGIHMIGARMGEQIGEAQLIVGWEAMPEDVASSMHAHPTQNEASARPIWRWRVNPARPRLTAPRTAAQTD
jgi:dihydrolipoamide dehydrogenase